MSGLFRAFFSFIIALFLCAQSVFAADGIINAFAGIAHDPNGDLSALQGKVQTLQDFVEGKKTEQDALSSIQQLSTSFHLSPCRRPVQDADGNNVAHKLLGHSEIDIKAMMKLFRNFDTQIWTQKNKDGLTPFEVHPEKLRIALQDEKRFIDLSKGEKWFLSTLQNGIKDALKLTLGSDYKFSKNPEDVIRDLQVKANEKQIAQEEKQRADGAYIVTLRGFMNGTNSISDAEWALQKLSGNEAVKPQILALRDSEGNNLAHKLLEYFSSSGGCGIDDLTRVCGVSLFNQLNGKGLTPIAAYFGEFVELLSSSLYGRLVSETPSFASEKDPYGNTMSALYALSQSPDEMTIYNFFANMFKPQALDATLWDRIIDHPYLRSFEHRLPPGGPDFVALYTTLSQTQTPLHRSFFQENLDRRDEANQLWRAFFTATERRIPEEFRAQIPQVHDAVKVLRIAVFAQQEMIHQLERQAKDGEDLLGLIAADPKLKTVKTLRSKILSTGGTFGMNFHRSANIHEAMAMLRELEDFGYNAHDQNEIIQSLIVPYPFPLTPDQQAKLDDHQILCAVFALNVHIKDFDEIDRLLADHPRVKVINSKARIKHFNNTLERLHRYNEF